MLTLKIFFAYPISYKSRLTFALPSDVVTGGAVVTVTRLRTVGAPEAKGTAVGAHLSHPAGLAVALPRLLVTGAAVLAAAFRFAFAAVGAQGAYVITPKQFVITHTKFKKITLNCLFY